VTFDQFVESIMQADVQQNIQVKAYEIWLTSGQPDDRALEHWLQAEREVELDLPQPKRKQQVKQAKKST
jgi:hypothetical protein